MRPQTSRIVLAVFLGLCVTGLGAGAVAFVRSFINSVPPPKQKVVQEIHLVRPPPPPPDEPPPPPPPPEEKVNIPDPQPEPDPTPSNEPPPSEQLGLDAEGTAGGDAFGLVGHKGGRDLLGSGGSAFAWYGGLIKNEILDRLGSEPKVRKGAYSAIVQIWVRSDGTIERVGFKQSTGEHDRDQIMEKLISTSHLSQAPPEGWVNPITFRIDSHG
jgi:periplasmic protein TonB